jgi:amidohydrolase
MGCIATVNLQMLTPAVINDPGIAELAGSIIQQMYPDAEIDRQFRTMGSEDFAFMMQKVPGCYLLIGSANDALGLNFSHHHPMFDFDEAVLPRASAILAALAMQVLDRLP